MSESGKGCQNLDHNVSHLYLEGAVTESSNECSQAVCHQRQRGFFVKGRSLKIARFFPMKISIHLLAYRAKIVDRNKVAIVTWLILPAIICLSQRLSHACLSISDYTAKLRMAHYISYNLLDQICYLDNCRNSRANTCEKFGPGATLGRMCLLVEKPRWGIQLRATEGSINKTNHSKFHANRGLRPLMMQTSFCPINFQPQCRGLRWL